MELDIHLMDASNPVHNCVLEFMDWRRRQGHTNMYLPAEFKEVKRGKTGGFALLFKGRPIIQWAERDGNPVQLKRLWGGKGE